MYTYEKAIIKTAQNVVDLKDKQHHAGLQRRNQVVDVYGMEFTRQGDTNNPATFYISISQDLIYYERFEFKIIIQPFVIPIAQNGMETVTLSASTSGNNQTGDSPLNINNNTIQPNPHSHTIPSLAVNINPRSHTHKITAGITTTGSTVSEFEVWIEGVNITPYLKVQYGGKWIHGEGIFPKPDLSNYDILEAVSYMDEKNRNTILKAGYKKIELKGTGVFNATLVNYLKYSHVNR